MASVWSNGITISIFGESYSKGIGVVIDNFPCGVFINFKDINKNMKLRGPLSHTVGASGRREDDRFEVLSGIYKNYTTGTPISVIIYNKALSQSSYSYIKNTPRPSHADFTGGIRYNFFNDERGGGHFSGRLTAPIVFAGSVCQQALIKKKIKVFAHIYSISDVKDFEIENYGSSLHELYKLKEKDIAVLDSEKINIIKEKVELAKKCGDSLGGVVECAVFGMPAGIGSPMFDGIENYISSAMFAIPAVKGIEFGKGFEFGNMKGSNGNDEFYIKDGVVRTKTNNNGGILGGISTGMPIVFKVAFKPTPTIFKLQNTVNLKLSKNCKILCRGYHDSCIALRGVVVVEAAANIAILSQLVYQGKY